RSVEIAPAPRESGIIIRVTARTPELAVRIADNIAARRIEAAEHTSAALPADGLNAPSSRKDQLSKSLAAVEAEIERIKRLSSASAEDQRRKDLAEAVSQAARERSDAVARAEAVRALLDKGKVE